MATKMRAYVADSSPSHRSHSCGLLNLRRAQSPNAVPSTAAGSYRHSAEQIASMKMTNSDAGARVEPRIARRSPRT